MIRRLIRILDFLVRSNCQHEWLRHRAEDGSYGLRCARCGRVYRETFTRLVGEQRLAGTLPGKPRMELAGGLSGEKRTGIERERERQEQAARRRAWEYDHVAEALDAASREGRNW